MLNWVTDESDDALEGTLDGVNRTFRTLQIMRLDKVVDVFVNGQLRVAELDNGYVLTDSRTVTLKQAPVPEDTVAVAYCVDQAYPAVDGGTPRDLVAEVVEPRSLAARVEGGGALVEATLLRPGPLRARLGPAP